MGAYQVQSQAQNRKHSHARPAAQFAVDLPAARVIQVNEDGSLQIESMGQRFRALTGAQLDDLARMEVDLNGARKLNQNLQAGNAELEKQKLALLSEKAQLEIKFNASEQKVASLANDLSGSRVETNRYFVLLNDEVKARGQAQQFIPHSGANGVVGKFFELLDKPAVQFGFKVGLPLFQGVRSVAGCR